MSFSPQPPQFHAAHLAADFIESQAHPTMMEFITLDLVADIEAIPMEQVYEIRCRNEAAAISVGLAIEADMIQPTNGWDVRAVVQPAD